MLIAVAFWTLAVIALTNLRYLHLGELPQAEVLAARATMACAALLLGLVGARCVIAWRKSGSLAPIRRTLGGTPGMLLFAAVASYLAIGAAVLGVEAIREPDTFGVLKYSVLHLGVLVAAVVGGRAVLERIGAERLLQGVLVILIAGCAIILASPVLRDLGILPPYRLPFRLTGAFVDPNEASLAACMTVALAAALLTNGGPRAFGWLGLAAGVAASLATGSRTALVVLGALAVVFLLINVRSRPRPFVLVLGATGLIGIAGFAGVVGFFGGFSEWSRLRSTADVVQADVVQEGHLFCDPSPTDGPDADCAVLLAARDILAGDMALNWSRTVPVNRWQGVTVDGPERHVTKLNLAGLGLNGRIPSDLGRLDRLVWLLLQRNRLTGRIPPELGDLASLERLVLNYNGLTGAIPPELGKLDRLEVLKLRQNHLTGVVPAALAGLDLSVLRLSGNDFDSVPPELTDVAHHDLADARPCLPLPPTSPALFDDCTVLLEVRDTLAGDASLNWHAAVPVGLWQGVTVGGPQERVVGLALAANGLTGRIPPELGRLDGLVHLNLAVNRLTGPVPPELGRLIALRHLSLDRNALTGAVPSELGRLGRLESLWLRENRLTGPVPPELFAIPEHDLSHQLLCAPASRLRPPLLNDCTSLLALKETLAGEAELNWSEALPLNEWQGVTVGGPPARVTDLTLAANGLTGRIPPELGRLDGLVNLNLAVNRLTGPIPPELGRLVALRHLSLDRNALTGAVPAELGQLGRLESLWLRENRLTGPVPPELFAIPEHDLSHQLLCAPASRLRPPLLNDCTLLLALKETLAGAAELNWSETLPLNEWQGVTVSGREGRVIALELPRMGLNGRVPAALGHLAGLRSLVLDGNVLAGAIPPELGKLTDLEMLGLAANALTGPIPPELARLSSLRELWLSGNRLTGSLPPGLRSVAGAETFCPAAPADNPGLRADCDVLLATRDLLAGEARLNWSEHLPIESWQGVTIGGSRDRVTRLELASSGLNGRIPPALGRLSQLVSLALNHNRLTGPVPPELGKLTQLERLALSSNDLSGPVPPELGKLSHLRELRLWNNRLNSLPPELRSVAGAETLCPAAPADNPGLRADCDVLLAARDLLAGEARLNWNEQLPIELWQGVTIGGSPDRVTRLGLVRSGLNGRVPPALGRLSELVSLALNRNRLTGPVPPELGKLTNLKRLVLSFNALSGPIPPELGKLSQLRELWLKNNRLSGPVPSELQGLEKLTLLRITGNDLDRPYPPRLFGIAESEIPASDFALDEARPGKNRPDAIERLSCLPSSGITSDLQADCALLLASRDVLAGDARLNWSEDIPIEFWQGVTVGGTPKRVTALELPRAGLSGRLFAELGELGGLVALNLSHNRLAGPIPPGLGGLEHLVSLRLEGNRLTGPVPPELEGLDNLSFLRLADNDLYRPFPPALHEVVDHDLDTPVFCRPRKIDPGRLADCALLLRVRDALAGDAPLNWREEVPVDDWLGVVMDRSRGRVTALELTQMGLNGRIPAKLGQLAGLVSLRLGRNRLAGGIPPALGNLGDLRMLALDGNLLTGSIPPELGKLSRLTDLGLHGNRLIGPAPPSVAALPELVALRLDDDDAAGETPTQDRGSISDPNLLCQPLLEPRSRLNDDCATLLEVRDVLAGDAELNWSDALPIGYWRGVTVGLPASAGDAAEGPRVIALDLSHTGLNGRIPAELSALDALAVLRLGDNRLAGSIPPELGALSGLRTLNLENNALTGTIPEELGALQGLVSLRLGNNALTGLTWQFTTLANLRVLALEDNLLTGRIHRRLGNLSHLEELRLENNLLHGSIPKALDGLPRLAVLRLGGNAFSDCVPVTAHAAQVRHNDLDSADLLCESPPWAKPGLFEDGARLMRLRDILAGDAVLNWSYARPVSSWQGVSIRRHGRVGALRLQDMNLTGRIPPELGELNHLYILRLDGNRLTGPIPPELGNLTRLTMLSLDGNRLTGPIPPALANLSNLKQLWLADNRLTGSIPPELAGIERLSLAVAGNDFHGCLPWVLQRLSRHDIDDGLICAALATDRPLLWRLGFEKAMEAPVFGHGLATLAYMEGAPIGHHGKPLGTHNLYLMLLGEAGIVPLLLFVSALVLLLRAQWGAPRSLARDATVAGVIVIALYSTTAHHLLGIGAFMFLAGLSIATGAAHIDGDRHVAEA